MREHEFQQNLRPAVATDLAGPFGKRSSAQGAQQAAAAERLIDQDRHAALGGERQQAFLGGAIVERIIELDEIERLLAQDGFELAMSACRVMGDADIADAL